MRKTMILAAVAAVGALVLAGCGSNSGGSSASGGSSSAAASSASAAPSSASNAVLKTADTSLGTVVVDAQGRTVYFFDKDTANSGTSACTGTCVSLWHAVPATSSSPTVNGVQGSVGTITGEGGAAQVTLNGLPLYTFSGDAKAGDTNGQAFMNIWWVVAPDGTKITSAGSGSSSGSSSSNQSPSY